MERYLSIQSIWKDEQMLEIRVSASNGLFSGQADCYIPYGTLPTFREGIAGFPNQIGQSFTFTTGENNNSSFFSTHFRSCDGSGRTVVRIKIAHIEISTNQEPERYMVEFDANVEPLAIDAFAKQLESLEGKGIGEVIATLRGI